MSLLHALQYVLESLHLRCRFANFGLRTGQTMMAFGEYVCTCDYADHERPRYLSLYLNLYFLPSAYLLCGVVSPQLDLLQFEAVYADVLFQELPLLLVGHATRYRFHNLVSRGQQFLLLRPELAAALCVLRRLSVTCLRTMAIVEEEMKLSREGQHWKQQTIQGYFLRRFTSLRARAMWGGVWLTVWPRFCSSHNWISLRLFSSASLFALQNIHKREPPKQGHTLLHRVE